MSDSTDNFDYTKNLSNANQAVRVFNLGKINRQLVKFLQQKTLSKIDIRLLKGFYTNVGAELDTELS